MERKVIVCLANSRKHAGRCVAGIEIVDRRPRGWIRPIGPRQDGEVSEIERSYPDGRDPGVLDIVSVPLARHAPDGHQPENWVIDPSEQWERRGQATWEQVRRLESTAEHLWPSDDPSSYNGLHDRVSVEAAADIMGSLRLIRVEELYLVAGGASGGQRVRASFVYSDERYSLSVTDPVVESAFAQRHAGAYQVGEAYLTISLGEPYKGYCYKLVAAVISRSRAEKGR